MSQTRNTGYLTNIVQYTPNGSINFVSGSTTLMSISSSGQITTTGVISGSSALSSSYAVTASYVNLAQTASSIGGLNQNVTVTGSLTTTGQIVAQTLNVQQVTSSIVYSSGSNIFGNSLSNTQQMTGSLLITGSTLNISSQGNVGIGVYPSAWDSSWKTVEIYNQGNFVGSETGKATWLGSNNYFSGSAYKYANTNGAAQYILQADGSHKWRVAASGTAGTSITWTDAMFLSSSGNFGIGTITPVAKLHVYASDTNMASSATTSYTYSKFRIEPYLGSSIGLSFGLISPNVNYVQASYNEGTTASFVINPYGGNVGIGTASPGGILDVQKNQNAQSNVYFRNTDNTNSSSRMYLNLVAGNTSAGLAVLAGGGGTGDFYIGGNNGGSTYFQPYLGGGVTMTLTNGSSVGIGTTSPYSKLDVRGAIAMGNADTYPKNVRFVKQGSTSITFTATVGTIGAWRPGHATIRVSGGQNGLQEYWAAWYYIRIIAYYGSGAIISVVDSGGDTGAVSFSSSANTSSPQTLTFTVTDAGPTTDTMIADIDLTYNEGIVSIS